MQHLLLDKLTQLKCDGMKIALQEQLQQTTMDSLFFEERLLLLLECVLSKKLKSVLRFQRWDVCKRSNKYTCSKDKKCFKLIKEN